VCAAGKSIFAAQIADMQKRIPGVQYEVFEGAGHALFVDDADRFNSVLQDFIVDLVWP
jgi:microsomal epoxide hydrolase